MKTKCRCEDCGKEFVVEDVYMFMVYQCPKCDSLNVKEVYTEEEFVD